MSLVDTRTPWGNETTIATRWRCGDVSLSLYRPRIMGVVNVTPDSFSDGGLHSDTRSGVAWGLKLLDDGADILDVGGESTRPGHSPVNLDKEMQRTIEVVKELANAGAVVSIDTRHACVADKALEAGAKVINDVSGFIDPEMIKVAAASDNAGCVVMHYGSVPVKYKENLAPESAPILKEVGGFLTQQAGKLIEAGVCGERICIDPGAGFDKLAAEDIVIQRNTDYFASLGFPLMTATSRKRFIGATSGVKSASERGAASVGSALAGALAGARVLRVHDVAMTAELLGTFTCVTRSAPKHAFVALGSNMGDCAESLRRAAAAINSIPLTRVIATSSIYASAPAYKTDQPVFANAVVEILTELTPLVLLGHLQSVENDAGRVRKESNGPRTLDCDLLWMEDEIHAGAKLALPHPLAGERDFVLTPLGDLMADPEQFLRENGVRVVCPQQRLGVVNKKIGEF